MQYLGKYDLPRTFRPVLKACNKLEMQVLKEYKIHTLLQENEQKSDELEKIFYEDPELEDITFIVRLQDELGIASATRDEYYEWLYTMNSMRTIENYVECDKTYENYMVNNINKYPAAKQSVILNTRELVKNFYSNIVFWTSDEYIRTVDFTFSRLQKKSCKIDEVFKFYDSD